MGKRETTVKEDALVIPIELDCKTYVATIGPYRIKMKKGDVVTIQGTVHDFLTSTKSGFDALCDKLKALATLHKFSYRDLLSITATSPLLRIKYFEERLHIPRFVGAKIQQLLLEHNAGEQYYSGIRKHEEFGLYLRKLVVPATLRSMEQLSSQQFKYTLPPAEERREFSEEMYLEEIRVCENSRGKYQQKDLAILTEELKALQQERRLTTNSDDLSDMRKIAKEEDERMEKAHEQNGQKNKKKRRQKP